MTEVVTVNRVQKIEKEMKSIEARFINIKETHPFWSDWVCFHQAVVSKKFGVRTIRDNFKRLVHQDDYDKKEVKQAYQFMYGASNMAEDDHFGG